MNAGISGSADFTEASGSAGGGAWPAPRWNCRNDQPAEHPGDLRKDLAVGFENAERFNIEAGLLKPDQKLRSYDNLFTDQFVR